MTRALTTLLALVLVVSLSAPAAVGPAAAAPAGMVSVSDTNVSADVPAGVSIPISESDMEGAVLAESGHADTLKIVLTTPEHADEVMGADGNVIGGGEVAIVFRDADDHAAREIAVDAGVLQDALGRQPEMVRGTHSSGETWRSPARYEDGYLVMEIESWSSNTVTFSGEVTVTGTFGDGATTSYSLSSVDSTSDPQIELTGTTTTETDTETTTIPASGGSTTVSVAGNVAPTSESVSLVANPEVESFFAAEYTQINDQSYYATNPSVPASGYVDEISYTVYGQNDQDGVETAEVDVYVLVDGTQVASNYHFVDSGPKDETVHVDQSGVSTIEIRTTHVGSGPVFADAYSIDGEVIGGNPGSAMISVGGSSQTISAGSSASVDLSAGSNTIDLSSSASGGSFDVTTSYTERTTTTDPSTSINGQQVASLSGTLADGSTQTFSANQSVLQEGSNSLDVSTTSVSSDAPPARVGVTVTHAAEDDQSVNYTATKWRESYNVSRTYADAGTSAQLTIPHDRNVVAIEAVETRTNGGSWSSTTDYALDNTTLTVPLGDVASGETVAVRTTARRIAVSGGEITVTDPTDPSQPLDTKIRLDSWSEGAHIGLGGSPDGRKIHYTYDESTGGLEYTRIESSGVQQLYLPSATTGAEMRVATIPVKADVKSGAAEFEVRSPSTTEPQFTVKPAGTAGDTVAYTYTEASDGREYILYSMSSGVVRDSGTANSPVTLEDDDSEETLVIRDDETNTTSSDSGGVLGPIEQPTGDGPLNSTPAILLAWVIALVVLYVVDRGGRLTLPNPVPAVVPVVGGARVRVPLPGSRGPLFWVGATGSTLVVLEFLSSGLISRTIFRTVTGLTAPLGQVVPLAGIVAIGLTAYYLYQRFIVGQQARDIVLRTDGGDDG